MEYKESDLVLQVSKNADPAVWDEGKYSTFLEMLFRGRAYQKEAAETALRYLNSGEYSCLSDLAKENFKKNEAIRGRFYDRLDAFLDDLGLPQKLSGTIDLATGTGKSYVMYAIAVIMLAEKKVDRVLVLTPSVTIESELTKKFRALAANDRYNAALGADYIPPSIINGDQTIVENAIAIENRDAIYKNQENRNSIAGSLSGKGQRTLVLNDEAHHVFYAEGNQWKYFIEDLGGRDIDFKYVLGFTGTAYKRKGKTGDANEYLSDVIYRFPLRDAIEQGYVKDIEYIDKEDMPSDDNERWQIILESHEKIAEHLKETAGILPVTIIVAGEKRRADAQAKKFKTFLQKKRNLSEEEVNRKVLCVHSGNSAAGDRLRLRDVDRTDNPVEFIFSVSMLTEGWDVKRVFQIVPDQERAFNSKLLISQVLGRGLRRPDGWQSAWGVPKVIVFNHEKWAPRVRTLVDELLDFKKTITVGVDENSDRHFELLNVVYRTQETSALRTPQTQPLSFLEEGYVRLPADSDVHKAEIELIDVGTHSTRKHSLRYTSDTYPVSRIAADMYDRFSDLPDDERREYYETLWPVERLEEMIRLSLQKSSNTVITRKVKNAFMNSMNVLFRDASRCVTYDSVPTRYETVSTKELPPTSTELSALKRNRVFFYSGKYAENVPDASSAASLAEIEDTTNSYRHQRVDNAYFFKTPQLGILTTGEPERKFVKRLTEPEGAKTIDAFVKSTDVGFYQFEYTWRKGTHQQSGQFNPDFFLKKGRMIVAVEIKDDSQISDPDAENIGKYKAARAHFDQINDYCKAEGRDERYKTTFLTPKNYNIFFERLAGTEEEILNFNSELDVALDKKGNNY